MRANFLLPFFIVNLYLLAFKFKRVTEVTLFTALTYVITLCLCDIALSLFSLRFFLLFFSSLAYAFVISFLSDTLHALHITSFAETISWFLASRL